MTTYNNQSGVYTIKCLITNKVYVGSSKHLANRKRTHWSDLRLNKHGNSYLQRAWMKYGENQFQFIVIEYCSVEDLLKREEHWITDLQSTNPKYGYNLISLPTSGTLSQNSRNKIADSLRTYFRKQKQVTGFAINPNIKARISKTLSGRKRVFRNLTTDHKNNIGKSLRNRWKTHVHPNKKTHCLRGHIRTPETINKNYTCKLCYSIRYQLRRQRHGK